jgi:hypothetical protein
MDSKKMGKESHKLAIIANAVLTILETSELSCLPRYNRESAVASISAILVEMMTNFGIHVNERDAGNIIAELYQKRLGAAPHNRNYAPGSKKLQ